MAGKGSNWKIFSLRIPCRILNHPDRKYDILIKNEGNIIRKNKALEQEIYIALLGPDPHVIIDYEGETSERKYQEAMDLRLNPPKDFSSEHLRLVGEALKKHHEQGLKPFGKSLQDYDLHEAFEIIYCYNCDLIISGKMSIFQFWSAFKNILGEDEDVLISESLYKTSLRDTQINIVKPE